MITRSGNQEVFVGKEIEQRMEKKPESIHNHWLPYLGLENVQILLINSPQFHWWLEYGSSRYLCNGIFHLVDSVDYWEKGSQSRHLHRGSDHIICTESSVPTHSVWIIPARRGEAPHLSCFLNSVHQIWDYVRKGVVRPDTVCSVLCCLLLVALTSIMMRSTNNN